MARLREGFSERGEWQSTVTVAPGTIMHQLGPNILAHPLMEEQEPTWCGLATVTGNGATGEIMFCWMIAPKTPGRKQQGYLGYAVTTAPDRIGRQLDVAIVTESRARKVTAAIHNGPMTLEPAAADPVPALDFSMTVDAVTDRTITLTATARGDGPGTRTFGMTMLVRDGVVVLPLWDRQLRLSVNQDQTVKVVIEAGDGRGWLDLIDFSVLTANLPDAVIAASSLPEFGLGRKRAP